MKVLLKIPWKGTTRILQLSAPTQHARDRALRVTIGHLQQFVDVGYCQTVPLIVLYSVYIH